MWFTSWSHDRQSSIAREYRCAHGFRRQRLAFWPALAALEERRLPSTLQDLRERGAKSIVLTAAVNSLWTVGAATAVLASVLGLMWAGPSAEPLAPEGPPGSGIIVSSEVTVIWMPQALRDLARHQAGSPVDRSPEELQTCLGRNGWRAAWYALTYRHHQIDGEYAEITQIRRLSEAADHLDELRAVMATAAGRPAWFEGRAFLHTRVEVIPDTLQSVDPREAITRLMADPVAGDNSLPTGGLDSTPRTE